jgi:hypothetical protein
VAFPVGETTQYGWCLRKKEALNNPDEDCFAFELPISAVARKTFIFIKRPFVKNGQPVPGKNIAVVIDPERMQSLLFKDANVGENGFISLLVKKNGRIWDPALPGSGIEVRQFMEADRRWKTWGDIPSAYQSITLKVHLWKRFTTRAFSASDRSC